MDSFIQKQYPSCLHLHSLLGIRRRELLSIDHRIEYSPIPHFGEVINIAFLANQMLCNNNVEIKRAPLLGL